MHQSDLKPGKISAELQAEFKKNGIILSSKTTIRRPEEGGTWLLHDKENRQTYVIREEDGGNLNVYALQ